MILRQGSMETNLRQIFLYFFNEQQINKKKSLMLLILLILSIMPCSWCENIELLKFKAQMQGYIKDLAGKLTSGFDESKCNCEQEQAFFYECKGAQNLREYHDFPKHVDCLYSCVYLSISGTYRLSGNRNQSLDSEINSMTCSEKAFICHSKGFNFTFTQISNKRDSRYAKTYVGSYTGAFVVHPGSSSHCDSKYDPTTRTWFQVGSTGRKNILFLFNMNSQSFSRSNQVAKFLINSTIPADILMYVDLNNCSDLTICSYAGKATDKHKNDGIQYLQDLKASNTWTDNHYSLFSSKIGYFSSNIESSEKNIVVLVTDNIPDSSRIQNILNTTSVPLIFISIILGNQGQDYENSSLDLLTQANNGFLLHDKDPGLYVNLVLKKYLLSLTQGLNVSQPSWTSIYEDAFDFGWMITGVMPSFDSQTGKLIGVTGLDIPINQIMYRFGISQTQVIDYFTTFYSYTSNSNNFPYTIDASVQSLTWGQGQERNGDCCPGDIGYQGLKILLPLVIIIPLIIITIIVVYCCWYKNREPPIPDGAQNNGQIEVNQQNKGNPYRLEPVRPNK